MQLSKVLSVIAFIAAGASAMQPQKQVLISFPNDTPQSELNDYKSVITTAGGEILHEYALIKGFIVKASSDALDTISTFSAKSQQKYKATIENDETVTTQG